MSLYFCVVLLMYRFDLFVACLAVFVHCLVYLGVVAVLLLKVMDVFSVGGGSLLDRRVWSSTECVCCACDPSVHLSVLSICFVCVLYVGSYFPI